MRLHAHEITVLHGLELDEPMPLGRGAYLDSYDAVRECFGLPEDPEPWFHERDERPDRHPGRLARPSSRTVLVRRFNWGPGAAPREDSGNRDHSLQHRHWFPADHRVESITDMFEERETLLHLLSIAVRSKLVSHTVITAVPRWMKHLNPNLRTESPGGHIGVFDICPEDLKPSVADLRAFAAAGRGWVSFCAEKEDRSTELAIRRTAASLGIAGGRLGAEDRLIDASVALEAMYGPFDDGEIRRQDQPARRVAPGPVRRRAPRDLQGNEVVLPHAIEGCPRNRQQEPAEAGARAGRRPRVGTGPRPPLAVRSARSRSDQQRGRMECARPGRSGRRGRAGSQALQVVQHVQPEFFLLRRLRRLWYFQVLRQDAARDG